MRSLYNLGGAGFLGEPTLTMPTSFFRQMAADGLWSRSHYATTGRPAPTIQGRV